MGYDKERASKQVPDSKKTATVGPFLSALIGGVTGAIEISCTYPTEYTKTVM